MHVLKFLRMRQPSHADSVSDEVEIEYRIACSGELYNRKVTATDWRKSDITRVLLLEPFELFVASHPFDDYPQELCARFNISYVTEQNDSRGISSSSTFLPDREIVEDLCSILSLLARRLVSPVGKIRERSAIRDTDLGSYGWDAPLPILRASKIAVWGRRPITIITSTNGPSVELHDPPPLGVDSDALNELLLKLPDNPEAEEIVHASRLYRTALELIELRPDITYQLLISIVETMAGVALRNYEPEEDEKLKTKQKVLKKAREVGLNDEQAKMLALEACQGMTWLKQKFKKFILDYVSAEEMSVEDPVFPWSFLRPPPEDFAKVLGLIYDARSGNLHRGYPFPPWVGLGTTPTLDPRNVPLLGLTPKDVPPVAWFERVVSVAARRFLIAKCSVESEPFAEQTAKPPT